MNNTDVKVSVIMPIYNDAYLKPALDSVLAQTMREIEVICVDDGSTDNSLQILKEYQQNDDRIRIVTETNAGPALARNNGIRRARGEYVAFFDDDDFYEPEFLQTLYSAAVEHDLDITISGYDVYNSRNSAFQKAIPSEHEYLFEEGKPTSKNEHPDNIFSITNGSAWNKLFKKKFLLEKSLVFLPDVKMYEDVYFVVTALSLAQRIEKIPRVLMHHRVHSDQMRAKVFRKYYSQVPIIYVKIKEFLMHHGTFAPLFSSYLNLTAGRCLKIFKILDSDAKQEFWNLLHNEYSALMSWHGRSLSDFFDPDVFEFVANVEIFDYAQYKKRASKGVCLRLEKIKSTINGKKHNKIHNIFARLFSRKKQ